jgi:hypothetical protein
VIKKISILFLIGLLYIPTSRAKLEYDSITNKAQLYGPYIKYNILNSPYSLGRFQIELSDINIELQTEESGKKKIIAKWPRFLMDFGQIKLITKNKHILLNESFSSELIGTDEKFGYLQLSDNSQSLLENLSEPFQICVEQIYEESYVKACSNELAYKNEKFENVFNGNNQSASFLNEKKSPKNAQINLSKENKKIHLELKFLSGFQIDIKDKIRTLNIENIVVDPMEKRIGIVDGFGSIRPTELTTKDRFFSFIKENNYFKNEYQGSNQWPQDLEDAEMEFAPYLLGGSIQLYGIILPHVPPPFEFKLEDNMPIATYKDSVELKGTKGKNEILAAKNTNELFIHENETEFLWVFSTPKIAQVNQNYLSLQNKKQDYYFSQRIFRAHQSSVAASAALSTSEALSIVPGYNLYVEHWFEKIWDNSNYSFQRWGVSANLYETMNGFKPNNRYTGKLSPINADILYRLSPGVRPVQSSFGLGLRYLNFTVFQSTRNDIVARLLGVGGFWHTAPQKLVDDIFNIVPFFRYPKWMEVSFFYYPLILSGQQLGLSFSWQLRGKMFFAKNWYLETSFNVNAVSFNQVVNNRSEKLALGTAHGTIGLGYLF